MKAIITVLGRDQVGIIAAVCTLLAEHRVNILNISQTIMQEDFVMVLMADLTACTVSLVELGDKLEAAGRDMGLSIRIQREDSFNAMHRI